MTTGSTFSYSTSGLRCSTSRRRSSPVLLERREFGQRLPLHTQTDHTLSSAASQPQPFRQAGETSRFGLPLFLIVVIKETLPLSQDFLLFLDWLLLLEIGQCGRVFERFFVLILICFFCHLG